MNAYIKWIAILLIFGISFGAKAQLTEKIKCVQDAQIWYTQNCSFSADQITGPIPSNTICAWTWNASGNCGEGETKVYMQFDFNKNKYRKAFVQSATLLLYDADVNYSQTTIGNNEMWLQRVTSPWDEKNISWNNGVPTHTTSNQILVPSALSNTQNYSIDISSMAKEWTCGNQTHYGIKLELQNNTKYRAVTIASNDCSNPALRPLIEVIYAPLTTGISKDTVCEGTKIQLNADINGIQAYKYQWSSFPLGLTSNLAKVEHTPLVSTSYFLIVENNGCFIYDTVRVVVVPKPIINSIKINPTPTYVGQPVNFSSKTQGGSKFRWNFNFPLKTDTVVKESDFTYTTPGIYKIRHIVSYEDAGCSDTLWMDLKILDTDTQEFNAEIKIPNAFTPNRDNINDKFQIILPRITKDYHLWIFNRWGEKIFESDNMNESWDGNYFGKACPQGVYFYILEYLYLKKETVSGTITLFE